MQQDGVALRFRPATDTRRPRRHNSVRPQVEFQNYVHRVVDVIRNGCVTLSELHSTPGLLDQFNPVEW